MTDAGWEATATPAEWEDKLRAIKLPTLVLHGSEDHVERGRELHRLIPDSGLVEYAGGHEWPHRLQQELEDALVQH